MKAQMALNPCGFQLKKKMFSREKIVQQRKNRQRKLYFSLKHSDYYHGGSKIIGILDVRYEKNLDRRQQERPVAVSEWPVRLELVWMNVAKES